MRHTDANTKLNVLPHAWLSLNPEHVKAFRGERERERGMHEEGEDGEKARQMESHTDTYVRKIMTSRDDENESEASVGVKHLSEAHMCE